MNAKLDTISGLVNMLLENRLKAVAQLPPKEFQAALPGLEDTLTAMRKSNTSPSPATIEAIREKLAGANRNQPSYWGAAAAIVSYRSPDLQHDIPDCRTPLRATIDRKTGGITPELPLFQFRNCKIDLNDPQWQELYDTILGVDNLYFIKCFVIYHGPIHASIPINDAKKMVFIDCAFELASQGTPRCLYSISFQH